MIVQLQGMWNLKPKNAKEAAQYTNAFEKNAVPMKLPGDVHSALVDSAVIPDPYYAKNELDIQWIGRQSWIVEREITLSAQFLKGEQYLVMEMADTFVRVLVNGKEAGSCYNMFRIWRFNVTHLLTAGTNKITLIFESPELHALEEAKNLPYPIPYSKYPVYSPHRNLVRKVQCHAGWDWGPCIMAFGVYESIRLEQTSKCFIDYVETKTTQKGENWEVAVQITLSAIENCTVPVSITISGEDTENATEKIRVKLTEGRNVLLRKIVVKNPSLWWPAGSRPEDDNHIIETGSGSFCDNTLYTLTVVTGTHKRTKKIAFRTLEVVSEEDSAGKSLYFKVNGRAVFAKGSNWIPCDALPARQTRQKYDRLLTSLIQSGQNCLRVWGGGQYEKECFYELCDKKGILIWHDCMFSCSMYPATADFLENVRKEIRYQIRRLKDHASIALWCGNNEDIGAINWYPETQNNRDRYVIDYDRLNEGILAEQIKLLDPERAWWPSSPSGGPNDFSDNWHQDNRGDMHYWSVWHEGKPFEAYYDITPRFVSEFGYQSFPSLQTVKTYAPKNQRNLTSPVMEFHQRNPRGNSIILENFSRYFRFPSTFESMLYLSQVQQAFAIKTAVEYWRSLRPHCMGSIIWQLNDVWPVASWSSIEYSGKWKLLHYAAKDFFSPIAVVLYKKDDKITVKALNDTRKELNAEVTVSFIDFSGKKIKMLTYNNVLKPDSATEITAFAADVLPVPSHDCFITAQLKTGALAYENTLFPAHPKECEVQKSDIVLSVDEHTENNTYTVTLSTDAPAFFVSLDSPDIPGIFSKNMFTLLPNEPKTVTFHPLTPVLASGKEGKKHKMSVARFKKTLTVTSLRDTY